MMDHIIELTENNIISWQIINTSFNNQTTQWFESIHSGYRIESHIKKDSTIYISIEEISTSVRDSFVENLKSSKAKNLSDMIIDDCNFSWKKADIFNSFFEDTGKSIRRDKSIDEILDSKEKDTNKLSDNGERDTKKPSKWWRFK